MGHVGYFASAAVTATMFLLPCCVDSGGGANAESYEPQSQEIGRQIAEPSGTTAGGDAATAIEVAAPDTIVQLFDWPFRDIEKEIPRLSRLGYGAVHVSPPTLSNPDRRWWARYQPLDYRVIDGPLGNEAEFKSMTSMAAKYGIRIVADVVLNHMANLGAGHDLTFPPAASTPSPQDGPLFRAGDFNPPFCISDYNDVSQVRNGRLCGGGGDTGLPDLKLLNADGSAYDRVLTAQRAYLEKLMALGTTGFRFDAIKHMDPTYLARLLQGMPSRIMSFGESIVSPNRESWNRDLQPFMDQKLPMKYYDFPLVETMRNALAIGGDLGGLSAPLAFDLRAIDGPSAVTFVVNHDIPQNPMAHLYMGRCSNTDRFGDPINERLAYAFILGRRAGTPYVYSDRGVTGGDGVATDAYKNAHARCDTARMVRFHGLVVGKDEATLVATRDQLAFRRGSAAIVALNKSGVRVDLSSASAAGLENGTYVDLLGGAPATVEAGRLSAAVAPRSPAFFVREDVARTIEADLQQAACESPAPVACTY